MDRTNFAIEELRFWDIVDETLDKMNMKFVVDIQDAHDDIVTDKDKGRVWATAFFGWLLPKDAPEVNLTEDNEILMEWDLIDDKVVIRFKEL